MSKDCTLTPKRRVTYKCGGRRECKNIASGKSLYSTSDKVYVCTTMWYAGFNVVHSYTS